MKIRKIFSVLLALSLVLSCVLSVSAAEWNPHNVDGSVAEQIEESNARVAQLWQKALSESISPVYRMGDEPQWDEPISRASLDTGTAGHWHWHGIQIVAFI